MQRHCAVAMGFSRHTLRGRTSGGELLQQQEFGVVLMFAEVLDLKKIVKKGKDIISVLRIACIQCVHFHLCSVQS